MNRITSLYFYWNIFSFRKIISVKPTSNRVKQLVFFIKCVVCDSIFYGNVSLSCLLSPLWIYCRIFVNTLYHVCFLEKHTCHNFNVNCWKAVMIVLQYRQSIVKRSNPNISFFKWYKIPSLIMAHLRFDCFFRYVNITFPENY